MSLYIEDDVYYYQFYNNQGNSIAGFICTIDVDFLRKKVLPHEMTLDSKVKAIKNNLSEIMTQLSPISLVRVGNGELKKIMKFIDTKKDKCGLEVINNKEEYLLKIDNQLQQCRLLKNILKSRNYLLLDGHHRWRAFSQSSLTNKVMVFITIEEYASSKPVKMILKFPDSISKDQAKATLVGHNVYEQVADTFQIKENLNKQEQLKEIYLLNNLFDSFSKQFNAEAYYQFEPKEALLADSLVFEPPSFDVQKLIDLGKQKLLLPIHTTNFSAKVRVGLIKHKIVNDLTGTLNSGARFNIS